MSLKSLFPSDDHLGLLTDLYELTMAAGYYAHGMADRYSTFELWFRRLPECRNYLVAAGLEQAVNYLLNLRFSDEQIEYLKAHSAFQNVPNDWFDSLSAFRFTGDLWAVPEGTIVFANEPVLRVSGPLMAAQIVETFLITTTTYQTLIASKAVRITCSADGRPVIDFGSRRAHGPQAGLLASRSSYIAGCAGTSNVEAGRLLNIPTVGTQAHSWVMTFADEQEAFRKFGETFPNHSTLLIDTYDTIQGVKNAITSGAPMQAVRLDSGDLMMLSREVRRILDEAGRNDVKIVASGDLNEYKIRDLVAGGAPIDTFGVGTEMVTSRDEPTLSTVYKLVEMEVEGQLVGKSKQSAGKETYPFSKQLYRQFGKDERYLGDVVVRSTESRPGDPLLTKVLENGKLIQPVPSLMESRNLCSEQLRKLPPKLLELEPCSPYPVTIDVRST